MQEIKIAVRQLIEFVLRGGDIDNRFVGKDRMQEGSRIHRRIQAAKGENYTSEYFLKQEISRGGILYTLDGRADGIEELEDGFLIDEIKSTALEPEELEEDHNPLHWAQAQCYGYMFMAHKKLSAVTLQLTYVQLETYAVTTFQKEFTYTELETFVLNLLDTYQVWAGMELDWEEKRTTSIRELSFPFPAYRQSQRELAVCAYNTIVQKKKLYAGAPTGIGKTVSTLFPALKAMGEGLTHKIFYLTAKEITRTVAEDTANLLRKNGVQMKSVTLTAKTKICFCEEPKCNPTDCPYARGHYDRVNKALLDILENETEYSKECIIRYAEKHRICPFEFGLDISLWSDLVICDYNYVFDPQAKLRRYFFEQTDFVFLVDEAHNLVDRSREMFSAEINKGDFLQAKRIVRKQERGLQKSLQRVNQYLLDIRKQYEEERETVLDLEPEGLGELLLHFTESCERWLKKNQGTEGFDIILELYFNALAYLGIRELYNDHFCTLLNIHGSDIRVKLFCLDPSELLEAGFAMGRAAIVFSATLAPLSYYQDVLGGTEEDFGVQFHSPFESKNLCLLAADQISTKYANRERSYQDIADLLYTMISRKKGNYMVYFSSYQYLNAVYALFCEEYGDVETLVQQSGMRSEEQREFLDRFSAENAVTLVGFSVLGGVFSEGIDLTGDRLIGTAIVGVGLPQVNIYQNTLRDYFKKSRGDGFSYAYTYPGFNKVMQAAGRVIRTERDRGVVLLIDERYSTPIYRRLFPKHWQHLRYIHDGDSLAKALDGFYSESSIQ